MWDNVSVLVIAHELLYLLTVHRQEKIRDYIGRTQTDVVALQNVIYADGACLSLY